MRKALHVHMLIQLLGFAHPQDLLANDVLPDTFRRLWHYVASVCFRSTEAFASHINDDAAMEKLAALPLLPLTPKQRGMLGEARVGASFKAQKEARGISQAADFQSATPKSLHLPSKLHSNGTESSSSWAAQVTDEVASSAVGGENPQSCLPT